MSKLDEEPVVKFPREEPSIPKDRVGVVDAVQIRMEPVRKEQEKS